MQVNIPHPTDHWMFVKDIDKVIRLDLGKHQAMLSQEKVNLLSYREAVSHSVKKKKHYRGLVGGEKFDDDALLKSIDQINLNTRHLSDKVKLTLDAIEHQTQIVDTLTEQLAQYEVAKDAVASRLVQ